MENKTPFPPEIEELILKRQVEAGNKADITVFYKCHWAAEAKGGFDWSNTSEGTDFWVQILEYRRYGLFYDQYPQSQPPYKGRIAGYPKEVVDIALLRCNTNGEEDKLSYLEREGISTAFSFKDTPEGHDIWYQIYYDNDFELFFNKYPKGTQSLTINNEERSENNESSAVVDREQGIKGFALNRTPNQSRKIANASKLVGDSAQNRVTEGRFAKCEISCSVGFQ